MHARQKTGVKVMRKPLSETEGADGGYVKAMPQEDNFTRIHSAIDALQALTDMDDELLLDACVRLEDEKKAKTSSLSASVSPTVSETRSIT
ncbi:hypothetical protein Bca52824_028025 [Brassica carinata]|uniref:Uncharacterized protein n=1 Tax=Brassica carinata TaxID=52824 RepID=A0A8X8AR20_BRACI|nr:hypothetical protein Bca52824_028025 [Brassica carinata]